MITGSHRLFGGSRWREMDTPEAGDGSGRSVLGVDNSENVVARHFPCPIRTVIGTVSGWRNLIWLNGTEKIS